MMASTAESEEVGFFESTKNKVMDWGVELATGTTGKVGMGMIAYKTMDYFLDDDAEKIESLEDQKAQLLQEKDQLLSALAGEGLSREKLEEYRKELLKSEGISELDRSDYSSDTSYRDAQILQYQGAVEQKAHNSGLDRSEVAQKGIEEGSGIGNLLALVAAVAAAYTAYKYFTGEDGELDQDKVAEATKEKSFGDKAMDAVSLNPLTTMKNVAELTFTSVASVASNAWDSVFGDDESTDPEKGEDMSYAAADENAEWGYDKEGDPYSSKEVAIKGLSEQKLEGKERYSEENNTNAFGGVVWDGENFTSSDSATLSKEKDELSPNEDGEKVDTLIAVSNESEKDRNPDDMDKVHALVAAQEFDSAPSSTQGISVSAGQGM